jgi:hypothetical protein
MYTRFVLLSAPPPILSAATMRDAAAHDIWMVKNHYCHAWGKNKNIMIAMGVMSYFFSTVVPAADFNHAISSL